MGGTYLEGYGDVSFLFPLHSTAPPRPHFVSLDTLKSNPNCLLHHEYDRQLGKSGHVYKNSGDISQGHGHHLEGALAGHIWNILSIQLSMVMNYDFFLK